MLHMHARDCCSLMLEAILQTYKDNDWWIGEMVLASVDAMHTHHDGAHVPTWHVTGPGPTMLTENKRCREDNIPNEWSELPRSSTEASRPMICALEQANH